MEKTIKLFGNNKNSVTSDHSVFGKKLGLFTKLFGCRHKNISRPFSQGTTGYRSCLDCGARKIFNPETLKTNKDFYCPPVIREEI